MAMGNFDREELDSLLESRQFRKLRETMADMNEVDIAEFVEEQEPEKKVLVFRMLPKELAADVFSFLEVEDQEHIINSITDYELGKIIEDLYVDDAVDMLEELPDKLETVLYSSMEGEQKKLYAAGALKLKEALETPGELEARERMQILADLMSLRQLCCDPSLCYSNYKGGSAKLETCMELLQNGTAAGHKILLFSQFTSMLSIIEKRLKKEKLEYYMLTGATPAKERMQMAAAVKRDQVPIFLISLKAGGTGLNLEAADMVILYDPWWNAAAESQAADRAHRIGQENQVTVFKLITKHTIEENILKLQEQKRMLADSVVAGAGGSFAGLTKEELLKVLGE